MRIGVYLLISAFIFSGCTRTIQVRREIGRIRGDYLSYQTDHMRLLIPPGTLADSMHSLLERSCEQYRKDILEWMGEKDYPNRVDVVFFPDKSSMQKSFRTQAEGISFATDQLAAFVYGRSFNGFTRHELAHVFSINLWGHSALWIEEGFATLMDEDMQTESFHAQAGRILDTKDFIPINKLQRNFNDYPGNWYRYVEAASLVRYIRDQYGLEAFKSCWQSGSLRVPGKSEKELLDGWQTFLRTSYGAGRRVGSGTQ